MSSDSKKSSLVEKLKAQGGEKGVEWDDGHHENVKKVSVGLNHDAVVAKFEYGNGSKIVFGAELGRQTMLGYEWEFDLESDEYITSVEGAYKQLLETDGAIVTMLLFKTNYKDKKYGPYGFEDRNSTKLTLKKEGYKIVGFHGRVGDESINAIGAYFAPIGPIIPLTPAIIKLEAYGGSGGTLWDDGAPHGIRTVYVGETHYGISYVQIEYVNGSKDVVVGDKHGTQTDEYEAERFDVDEDDYLVYVQGYHGDGIIKGLKFKTYKGDGSQLFGKDLGTKFVLQGGRIVGFHGRSKEALISLGAYISFSSTPNILGEWIMVDQAEEDPRLSSSHAITQIGNKIYSFGGVLKPNQPTNKHLYVFDIENRTWSISPPTGDVPNHLCQYGVLCMVSVGSTIYVIGGKADFKYEHNGFYSFDTNNNEWKLLTPIEKGPSPGTMFYSMAADENNLYVFGGKGDMDSLKTLHVYNIADQKWVKSSTPEDLIPRRGPGFQVVEGKVWVIYGYTESDELDDVHCYDIDQEKWTRVKTFGEKPSERSVFASAVVGKHIVIFGGIGETDMDQGKLLTGETFALDTETLVWEIIDKLVDEKKTPNVMGRAVSTAGTIDGKKGFVIFGGKAQTNDRFNDLYFFGVENA